MTIIEAINDERYLRPAFRDLSTWRAWLVFLRALFGLPVEDPGDLELLRAATELRPGSWTPIRMALAAVGRGGGKSFCCAVCACWMACHKDWRKILGPGETGYVFILATDRDQAQIILRYVKHIIDLSPSYRRLVKKQVSDGVELVNGAAIAVKTSSFRGVRGFSIICAIMEEAAFWRSEESANPALEVARALYPGLARVPGSLCLVVSSTYSANGFFFDEFTKAWGKGGDTLVWRASTLTMRPNFDPRVIERALEEDPEAARAEWLCEWRQDVSAFLPEELVRSCVVIGRHELPRINDASYFAFIDPSGGRQDSFTLGIAHREQSGKVVLDVMRERVPPFRPEAVVEEFCGVLKGYGINEVESDRYAGEWVTDAFRKFGVRVKASELSASELFLELLPRISQGSIELLDSKRLRSQLANLERRTGPGGRDQVMHFPGSHDDLANATAGVIFLASKGAQRVGRVFFSGRPASPSLQPFAPPRRGRVFVSGGSRGRDRSAS
jgi:hypothetical protein